MVRRGLPPGGEEDGPGDVPWPHGPISNPVDRFAHLPEPTRRWLEDLRQDDINKIIEAVKFWNTMRSWGKVTKWLILTMVAVFLGAMAVGEGILKLLGWIARGGRP